MKQISSVKLQGVRTKRKHERDKKRHETTGKLHGTMLYFTSL